MKINVDLSNDQIVSAARGAFLDDDYELFLLIQHSTSSYEAVTKLINRLYDSLPSEYRNNVKEYVEHEAN